MNSNLFKSILARGRVGLRGRHRAAVKPHPRPAPSAAQKPAGEGGLTDRLPPPKCCAGDICAHMSVASGARAARAGPGVASPPFGRRTHLPL